MPGGSSIESAPDTRCRTDHIGERVVMDLQQPVAMLPMGQTRVGLAKQHRA